MLLSALFWIFLSQAEVVTNNAGPEAPRTFPYSITRMATESYVDRELACIRSKDPNSARASMASSASARGVSDMLATSMMRSFQAHRISPRERALFYSQMMVETGGLTHLTETNNLTSVGDRSQATSSMLAMDQLFKAVVPTGLNDFRGRGLIQTTHCDNYLSTIHYMNMRHHNRETRWQPYWETSAGVQISRTCTPEQLADIKDTYRKRYGFELDPFNLLNNMEAFGVPGMQLKDAEGNTMYSERLISEAAMAYWRGRCGSIADQLLVHHRVPERCRDLQDFRETDRKKFVSRCMTSCIKGSSSTWEERNRWYEIALSCIEGL